jgi:hypothetical protein
VFGLLVAATIAAFFVTTRLKRGTAVLEQVFVIREFSPNGDGRNDEAKVRFNLPERQTVTVDIVDDDGERVRRLARNETLGKGRHRYRWDGRTDGGAVAPDGLYRVRVGLRSEGRSVTSPKTIGLDTTPPEPRFASVAPPVIAPDRPGPARRTRITFRIPPTKSTPLFRIYRTDGGPPREVGRFNGRRNKSFALWDGRLGDRPAPDGVYALALTARDRAENEGSTPRSLPPRPDAAVPRSGVSVRYLAASGPLEPVRAGSGARIRIGPVDRRFTWTLSPAAGGTPVKRGRGRGRRLTVPIPSDTRTGVYLVRIKGDGHSAAVPLAVQGRPTGAGRGSRAGAGSRPRPLVVLPAITWQGENQVDDDGDGFPNTLEIASSARAERAFARGRAPRGLESEVAPLLRFMDSQKLAYDLTTDLALARRRGPGIEGRPGIIFAGAERWLTEDVDLRVRDYVDAGGRVASFGLDSFRRRVALTGDRLTGPSEPERANVFGERAGPLSIPPAPLAVSLDRRGLFAGTDGLIGLFERFEQSEELVPGARIVAAAGRDPAKPALVAYELGRGLVIRVGAAGWSRRLGSDEDVGIVTRRIWTLLSQSR